MVTTPPVGSVGGLGTYHYLSGNGSSERESNGQQSCCSGNCSDSCCPKEGEKTNCCTSCPAKPK
ncbi:hypothetical protein MHLP_03640 [Candidatus Mycoplasma haematolamae str. Purdue]|uniref:Uncharacterized protein n=1 Tax=Mycoplasma haematolamae (strain Purdue) TaxID=1212765 RepID=I7BKA1_MYCHA|nr:hypothetical protein [Candidatus Mycoplasma haematolamae]AFO52308.1 hypothetical protein MHLP_03640 [Candidatus Mycoplasma haematolamae str. Purdue]